jgi:hypothetical protein
VSKASETSFIFFTAPLELTGDPFILKTNGRGEKSTSFSTLISAQTQSQDSFLFSRKNKESNVRKESSTLVMEVNGTRDDDSSKKTAMKAK